MTFEEWCYNNGYTQLDVDVYNFGKEAYNAGIAEGFEQAVNKDSEETKLLSEHIRELQKQNGELTDKLTETKEIIKELCGTVRALNNPNTQLTDVNGFLQNAEAFLKE